MTRKRGFGRGGGGSVSTPAPRMTRTCHAYARPRASGCSGVQRLRSSVALRATTPLFRRERRRRLVAKHLPRHGGAAVASGEMPADRDRFARVRRTIAETEQLLDVHVLLHDEDVRFRHLFFPSAAPAEAFARRL